ncbi:hypothetical protein AB0J55_28565 [Amycolatopsis sp. NPDC049688]|uniref:hypothetical protein n=1 Tax=Amycolatopsis sp. NPDC049688 TaxID=3154733 RepID=UPI003431BB5F
MPWERYSGDDIEAVIAMMVLRQHPRGQRIRPSRGDGGIDVLVPHAPHRWEVFQIKKFTTTRDRSQERQITKSWNSLLAFTKEEHIRVSAWHVVRPIDPTREDREWLAELTADSGIPSDWIGLTTVDNWAADYPQVVDYYFNNGQQYVLDTARTLMQALNATGETEPSTVLQPATALASIRGIVAALNKTDPHYNYRLSAQLAPEDSQPVMTPAPGAVFSAVVIEDSTMSQLDIIARYDQAQLDRPLPMDLRVTITPETDDVRQQMRDFLGYGIPFTDVPASVVTAELPGGFSFADMDRISVSVLASDQPRPFELRGLDHDDNLVATLPLVMQRPTEARDGTERLAWTGHDVADIVTVEFRIDLTDHTVTFGVTLPDISGANPALAAESLAALHALKAGCRIKVGVPGGPPVLSLAPLPEDLVSGDAEPDYLSQLSICVALRTLQAKIARQLLVPELSTVEQEQAVGWLHAAILVEGHQVVTSWSALSVTQDSTTRISLPCWVRVTWHLTVEIDGAEWNLGYIHQTCKAEHWTPTDQAGGGILTPGEDDQLILTIAGGSDEDNQAQLGRVHTRPIDEP